MKLKFYLLLFMLIAGSLVLKSGEVKAQEMGKYQALYIYNFTKYIQWPKVEKDITIGVMGEGKINQEVSSMVDTKGEGRLSYKKISSNSDISGCDIIFMTSSQDQKLASVVAATKGKSILIISESEMSARNGAGISFYTHENKLKFIINKGVIDEKNMKISSSLMNLAKVI